MSQRSPARRFLDVLASRSFSFWVLGAWIGLTAVWLVPFQVTGQPDSTIVAIAQDWFAFRAMYVIVGIATVACTAIRLSRDLRRLRPVVRKQPISSAEGPFAAGLEDVERALMSSGYTVTRGDDCLHATRHRLSLLGGSLFHFAIVLFGMALVAHLATVETTMVRVTEGQTFAEAVEGDESRVVAAGVQHLQLRSITPEYYKDYLLFSRLDAVLVAPDGSERKTSLSRPYWFSPISFVSIADYSLAPHIEITDPGGVSEEYVYAMNLSPPGAEDKAEIAGSSLVVSVIAYPDYGVVAGRDVSLSHNIVAPAFMVAVRDTTTSKLYSRELVRLGEPIEAAGYTIRIPELSRYGTFRVTSAPALPFMALALVSLAVGPFWRYGWRRSDVLAWATPQGLMVDGWRDMAGRAEGRQYAIARLRRAGVLA